MKKVLKVLLLLIVIMVTGCGPKKVDLPDVVGMNVDEGISKLNEVSKSFKISKTYEHSREIGKKIDEIVSVKHSGDQVFSYSRIELVINDARSFVLPDFKGMTIDEAKEKLQELGIKNEAGKNEDYSETIENGKIIRTQSENGGRVLYYIDKYGNVDCDEFNYVISKGKDLRINVPNVVGKSESDAIETLTKAGIKYSFEYEFPKTIEGARKLNYYTSEIIKQNIVGRTEITNPIVTLTSKRQSVIHVNGTYSKNRNSIDQYFAFKNNSDKDIKYINVRTFAYDAVGERIITTSNTECVEYKIIGPIKPGATCNKEFRDYSYIDTSIISTMKTGDITVEFMDGTSQIIKYED